MTIRPYLHSRNKIRHQRFGPRPSSLADEVSMQALMLMLMAMVLTKMMEVVAACHQ
jgi:hypothetical protein